MFSSPLATRAVHRLGASANGKQLAMFSTISGCGRAGEKNRSENTVANWLRGTPGFRGTAMGSAAFFEPAWPRRRL